MMRTAPTVDVDDFPRIGGSPGSRSRGSASVESAIAKRPLWGYRLVIAAVVALVFGTGFATTSVAAPAHAYDEGVIVTLANEARAENGLDGLVHNSSLDTVALDWAWQLAADGTLSHNPAVGSHIPSGWTAWGENVAQGHSTGADVHDAWMNSAGHRANILGDFTDIGTALIEANGASWAVQVFATYPGSRLPGAAGTDSTGSSSTAPDSPVSDASGSDSTGSDASTPDAPGSDDTTTHSPAPEVPAPGATDSDTAGAEATGSDSTTPTIPVGTPTTPSESTDTDVEFPADDDGGGEPLSDTVAWGGIGATTFAMLVSIWALRRRLGS